VRELFNAIVGDGPDESVRRVCSSHLILHRSVSEEAQETKADAFWPVHQAVLRIVKPACILVMGSGEAFDEARKMLEYCENDEFPSGHPAWPCKVAEGNAKAKQPKLIGMPHFGVAGLEPHALERIAKECRTAAGR
jgi:hypothetical protein